MFKILKSVETAKKRAEEAIKRSEDEGQKYREAVEKNAEAHAELMSKIDRRLEFRRA